MILKLSIYVDAKDPITEDVELTKSEFEEELTTWLNGTIVKLNSKMEDRDLDLPLTELEEITFQKFLDDFDPEAIYLENEFNLAELYPMIFGNFSFLTKKEVIKRIQKKNG